MAYPLFKIWGPTNALQIINQIIRDVNFLLLSGGNSVGVNGISGVTNIAFTARGHFCLGWSSNLNCEHPRRGRRRVG